MTGRARLFREDSHLEAGFRQDWLHVVSMARQNARRLFVLAELYGNNYTIFAL